MSENNFIRTIFIFMKFFIIFLFCVLFHFFSYNDIMNLNQDLHEVLKMIIHKIYQKHNNYY